MSRILLAAALLLGACSRKDPVDAELQAWKALPHVFVAVNGEPLMRQLETAARNRIALSPNDLDLEYLTSPGRFGALLRVYTREDLIPSGTTFIPVRRTHALDAADGLEKPGGVCVDADAAGACRIELDPEQTAKLRRLLHELVNLEQPIAFQALRRP